MADDPKKALLKEFDDRFSRAQTDKLRVKGRHEDIYRLVMPHRHIQDGTGPQDSLDEIFDSTAIDATADFASDILNAFTPSFTGEWVVLEPSETLEIDAADKTELARQIAAYKLVLWQAIRESNLAKAARECYRDLAVGTMAMLIQDVHPSLPIECTCVPVSDLFLDRGPGGSIDGRFRRFKVRAQLVPVMWKGAKLPPTLVNSQAEIDVTEGMWRDWSDRGTETWVFALITGGDVLLDAKYTGEGSCPMLVCPWDIDGSTAWGFGPLYNALADIKTVNKAVELVLRNADRAIDPVVTYTDDGVIDVSQGVSSGDWIPVAANSEVKALETHARFDVGYLQIEKLQHQIKRALFQDKPEQLGRTPPTATQWLEMARETSRRMGAPAGGLVVDWQFPIVRRFAYLLAKRGTLPPVKFGSHGPVKLTPKSAMVRSGEQEEGQRMLAVASSLTQLLGPQQAMLIIDGAKLGTVLAKAEGVDDLGVIRTPEQVQQLVQQGMAMAQQAGMLPGQQGGQGQ
ncbi:portal protein [Azospirillum doebereinerae]|uniref:portal protein n=1 Tax=Azospirillum doebereinerae TaxID=92933 RepID=UPI001EE57E82|nr:portal protein [Azospirillum doebereinerae]MCG5241390.1 portal protein [Azospirillum doebereinerae]